METTTFGTTGLRVSRLGFGAAPIGLLDTEQRRVEEVLNLLLDAGVNLIDTAACYAGSEEMLGKALANRRKDLVLVSKCGHASGLPTPDWEPQTIRASIDRSLQRLRTDHLDVLLLHSCKRDVLERGEALAAILEAKSAGKVRHAGYSGDNDAAAYAASLPDIDVIETSVNICDQRNLDSVLPRCRERGLGVLAKRPIANAAWKSLSDQPGFYKDYAKEYSRRLAAMKITPADVGLRASDGQAWPELAMRFTLAQPGVHCAIIGTTSPANAKGNIAAAAAGPLPEPAVKKLREAFNAAETSSGQTWTGET